MSDWNDHSELDELYAAGNLANPPSDHLRQLHWIYRNQLADFRSLACDCANPALRENLIALLLMLVPKLLESQREYTEALCLARAEGRLANYISHASLPALDLPWSANLVLTVIAPGQP